MSTVTRVLEGRRVIVRMYAAIVALAGVVGWLLGAVILPATVGGDPVASLGPISFHITATSMAIYGVLMVGVSLGVLLLAVIAVSERYVEP